MLAPLASRQIGDLQCNAARIGIVTALAQTDSAVSKLATAASG